MDKGYFKADILRAKALLICCNLTAVNLTYTKGWQEVLFVWIMLKLQTNGLHRGKNSLLKKSCHDVWALIY